ncbi:MAG: hypothetical protein ACKVWR_08940 [Acidimicrobiales bacterium]
MIAPARCWSASGDRPQAAVVVRYAPYQVVALVLGACGTDDAASSPPTSAADYSHPSLPGWIQRVQPAPDAQSASERAVEVGARTLGPLEELRLLIDGVDVTAQALPDDQQAPIPAETQRRAAGCVTTRERSRPMRWSSSAPGPTRPPSNGAGPRAFGAPSELVDSYTWSFRIQ